MEIFNMMKDNHQEQIAFYTDKSVKLRAILSIHSTTLGPALGGVRILKYKSMEDAMTDLIRLSQAMTYKCAAAGLNLGGGQIVIIDQEGMDRTEPLFRALGRFIASFKGRFISGGDMGVTEESMEYVSMETKYVTGLPAYYGGSGNQSRMCARGTFMGIRAMAEYRWDTPNLANKKIIIQGYGRIGSQLADFVKAEGAHVIITDINPKKMKAAGDAGFETMDAGNVLDENCDIFAPCATGPIISPETVEKFKCHIIAGSANNQLLNETDDLILQERGILYAPDFIINAGASIDAAEEYMGYYSEEYKAYKMEKVEKKVADIYDRLHAILKLAEEKKMSANLAAIEYAQTRIDSIKQIKGIHVSKGKI